MVTLSIKGSYTELRFTELLLVVQLLSLPLLGREFTCKINRLRNVILHSVNYILHKICI